MMAHFAIRSLMHDAALRDMSIRIGFSISARRASRPAQTASLRRYSPLGTRKRNRRRILDEVLQERVPPRPSRRNARGVKRKMSGYGQMRQRASQSCSKPIVQIVK